MGFPGQITRGVERWLSTYIAQWPHRRRTQNAFRSATGSKPKHLLLCIADHFEPRLEDASLTQARARLERWVVSFPKLATTYRDDDGVSVQHTFFTPIEAYDPVEADALADFCRQGIGETEVHLHHDNDTPDHLRETFTHAVDVLSNRHGLLGRRTDDGRPAYVFIHGNWCLCNSRPDGRYCGVDHEIPILVETGCCADMTMPSAPSPTQTRLINRIYYASDRPGPFSHDTGVPAGAGPRPAGSLLMIPGPLMLDWRRRKAGVFPRIENACLQGTQPPNLSRIPLWMNAGVQIPSRPDWFFVKLHTHGANERNMSVLLDEPMRQFHAGLRKLAETDPNFHYHYVTAREMTNLALAALDGWRGTVADARDYAVAPPPIAARRHPRPVAFAHQQANASCN